MALPANAEAVFCPADPPRTGMLALYQVGRGALPPVLPDDGAAQAAELTLALPAGATVRRRTVAVRMVPVAQALPGLLELDGASDSLAAWAAALRAAVGLVARGRLLPAVSAAGFDTWRVGPLDAADAALLDALAGAFPPQAYATAVPGSRPLAVPDPRALIRAAWDAVADTLVRSAAAVEAAGTPLFAARAPQRADHLRSWLVEAGGGPDGGAGLVLRVQLPDDARCPPALRLQLRSAADPSLVVDTAELWQAPAAVLARFGPRSEDDLLRALRRAGRVWPPLAALLHEPAPTGLPLDDAALEELLGDHGEALASAGVEVLWPAELFADPVTVRATATAAPGALTPAGLDLQALLEFRWELCVGSEALTAAEVDALAEAKRPVVRLRGRWVAVDRDLLARLGRRRARDERRRLSALEALAAALTGTVELDGQHVQFRPPPALDALAERLAAATSAGAQPLGEPEGLTAELRPYQRRGLAWLAEMTATGLGGCLADDMGLGKTVQVIAVHLHRRGLGAGPTLVVCPTSLLGTWAREVARFAPGVPVRRFHGGDRHLDELRDEEIVLVTYGVVRRDRAALAGTRWGLVVADEAQHVKNPLSRTARELRAIPAAARVALTGTPVENRLTDLWAILDWTTPGLLGPLERFRHTVAVPVERYRDPQATERLARLTRPFLLRRRKTDPGIAPELPAKTETDELVALTAEQATLYEAVVRESLAVIERTSGIERRGLVLKLLTGLKQICNHPAQYLGQAGPLPGRSGKLAALDELVDIIAAAADSVLVFTQYVQMARLLQSHLGARGVGTLFLHGGVPARRREEMVAAFQAGAAPVFLLSVKAGGTGLTLTRATHVIHYDRWWNPAVEDQATDRAYRIGQDRPVQVHRLVVEGTVEDRIATLLAAKRDLADAVVGSGEAWLADLDDASLADLVALSAESPPARGSTRTARGAGSRR